MRVRRSLVLVLGAAVALGAAGWVLLAEESWCATKRAQELRRRSFSLTPIRTVDRLLVQGSGDGVVILAHRGGFACEELDRAPENSLANVEKAIRMGFGGFETDLWRTRDGAYLIHHDGRVGRTTSPAPEASAPPGTVESSTLEEMRALRLRYPSGEVSSELVPTLRDLLTAGRGRVLFLVELKGAAPAHFPEILKLVEDMGATNNVLFWVTWRPEWPDFFEQQLAAGIDEARSRVVWRVGNLAEYEDVLRRFKPEIIDLRPDWDDLRWERFLGLTPRSHLSLVERAIEDGVIPIVSRVSTQSYLETLYNAGVRVFMSRSPERHLSYLIEAGLEPSQLN